MPGIWPNWVRYSHADLAGKTVGILAGNVKNLNDFLIIILLRICVEYLMESWEGYISNTLCKMCNILLHFLPGILVRMYDRKQVFMIRKVKLIDCFTYQNMCLNMSRLEVLNQRYSQSEYMADYSLFSRKFLGDIQQGRISGKPFAFQCGLCWGYSK